MGKGEPGKQNVDANNATEMSQQQTQTLDKRKTIDRSEHQNKDLN